LRRNAVRATDTSASGLLQYSLAESDEHADLAAMLSGLTRDELHLTLLELLDLIHDFVHHLAQHNGISERAVLRSMGIEPSPRSRVGSVR
jgi:hypothetical protein